MKSLTALSLSIGVLGGVATWLALGPLAGTILIWAVFVAWAAFFAVGGNSGAMVNTIVCGIFGAVCAWVAAFIILKFPMSDSVGGLPVWAAIVVAITVIILVMAANIPALSTIPASVLGYASTFAFLLQTPEKLSLANLMSSVPADNALITIAASIVVGAIFGMVSGSLAGALTSD
ncbi:MAG: DUF1097 domain-containing protein [Gammaproteobacteria bacterium]